MATTVQIAAAIAVIVIVALLSRNFFAAKSDDAYDGGLGGAGSATGGSKRDFVARMKNSDKNVIIFYGSQTGTSEDLANKLGKELHSRLGLKTMVADIEDYDFENLDSVPKSSYVFFLVASYGEGEPTDNAVNFWDFITGDEPEFTNGETEAPLVGLKFGVFGLGNSTYEHFNKIGRDLNARLEELGATRISVYGEGDDGKDTTEEDYLTWKEQLITTLQETGIEAKEYEYEPCVEIKELKESSKDDASVYLGEPNKSHLSGEPKPPFNHNNPFLSPIKEAHELFKTTERNCVHMEFDISGSGLRYVAGDHLAFWPQNSNTEVERFLKAVGLYDKRDTVVNIKSLDPTASVKFPVPTTYDTIVRHFLEINGPVSRQSLANMAGFAPTEEIRKQVLELGNDKDKFHEQVSQKYLNLARLMLQLSGDKSWEVPFSFFVEEVPHLQPRFYSISSSDLENKDLISITGVVERSKPATADHTVYGVATNQILALMHVLSGKSDKTYDLEGPRGRYGKGAESKALVNVRHSNFKLPPKQTTPLILIGPGTGVAPLRSFIRTRAVLAKQNGPVGKALLFFGSRTQDDSLYQDEWSDFSDESTRGKVDGEFSAKNFLEVHNAFSRESSVKVYVQDRIKEQAENLAKLIDAGAYIYVCGDASRMARDVQSALATVIAQARKISAEEANEFVKKLKARSIYQEDIW